MFKQLQKWLYSMPNDDILLRFFYQPEFGPYMVKHKTTVSEPFYQFMAKKIATYTDKHSLVLDVGCGLGRIITDVATSGVKKAIGLDANSYLTFESKAIAENHRNYMLVYPHTGTLSFQTGDVQQLPFEKNSFTHVICVNLIDRIKDPKHAIAQIHMILKKGGILFLCDPYDWRDNTTPKENQTDDMKTYIDLSQWKLREEIDNIAYILQINPRRTTHYQSHLLILQKK